MPDVIPAPLNEWIDWDDLGDCVEDGPAAGSVAILALPVADPLLP